MFTTTDEAFALMKQQTDGRIFGRARGRPKDRPAADRQEHHLGHAAPHDFIAHQSLRRSRAL